MAETQRLPIIEEEEIIDDDFYEKIEAPKFVDLTAPDTRRPDDDRHWFCFRVGCDEKHEQELDSEAIYKKFVLRVMAARSPNVRLRKALNRREASEKLKCPLSAPAKPRVSRMVLISSLSHKMTDNNVKVKPLSKVAATPNAKVKQPTSVAKALTTPRNQKKVSNTEQFRSVQSKKAMTVAVPKSRVVAKALVFHSPKKVVKIKSSVELNTSMRALCSAMKKLELNGVKKNTEGCKTNSLPETASRKQFKGREVKSRVFDSLYSNNRKEQETNTVRCLKEKKVKGMLKQQVTAAHENELSDMEMDEKSRCDSPERCHESRTSGSGSELSLGAEKSQEQTRGETSVLVLSEASRGDFTSLSSSNNEENKTSERRESEERRNSVTEKGIVPEANKRKAGENSMASDDKENERQLTENDDKENASSPDENIVMSTNNDDPKKAFLGVKHEDPKKTHKKSASTPTASQVVKYRKLKPTHPKPFKLRTDERGILKEANLDKKIPSPLKETTVKGGGNKMKKHQNKSETSSTQSEQDTDNYSNCDEKSNQTTQKNQSGSTQNDNASWKVLRRTTPHRNHDPKLQKPIELDDNFKGKSQMMQRKVVRPRSALSRKKEKVVLATKLSVIIEKPSDIVKKPKEAGKPRKNGAASLGTSRPCSRGRRPLTVPKEPKFQSLHVPRDCTTKKQT